MLFPLKHDVGLPAVPPSPSFTSINNNSSSAVTSSIYTAPLVYTPAVPELGLTDLTLEFTRKSQNYDHPDYNYNVSDNRCGYLPLDGSGAGGMSRELLLDMWGQTFAKCVHRILHSTPTPAPTLTADVIGTLPAPADVIGTLPASADVIGTLPASADVIDLSSPLPTLPHPHSTVIIDLDDDSKHSADKQHSHTTTRILQHVSVPMNTPYVDHYQPKTIDAYAGTAQEGSVGELYTWLQTWLDQQGQGQAYDNNNNSCSGCQNKKSKRAKKGQNYDDFLDDDDENDEYTNTNTNEQTSNILILQGPTGAGKTNAVYTCARSLGLGVIEVNPGQDRKAEIKTLAAAGSQHSKVLVQYILYITSTLCIT